MTEETEEVEKINLNDITEEYEVKNTEAFKQYLKQVWKDLNSRSGEEENNKGIDKLTFQKYYVLPGIISERLFSVFDSNNTGYLTLREFTDNMLILFSSDLEQLLQFVLKFYDFDRDNKITKEDVRVVLSYIPIYKKRKGKKSKGLKLDTDDYSDRLKSQKELHEKLDIIFGDKESLDFNDFSDIIKNKNSDIFLFILVFLYEHRPFSPETVKNLENIKKSPRFSPKKNSNLIASPNLDTNFIVSQTLQKSPAMKNAALDKNKNTVYKNMKFLGLLSGRNMQPKIENNNEDKKENTSIAFSMKIPDIPSEQNTNKENKEDIKDNNIIEKKESKDLDENSQKKPKRKQLKYFSEKNKQTEEKKYYEENEEEEIMNFSYARPFEGNDIPKKNSSKEDKKDKGNDSEEENEDGDGNEIIDEETSEKKEEKNIF